jgi:hypothetical protein
LGIAIHPLPTGTAIRPLPTGIAIVMVVVALGMSCTAGSAVAAPAPWWTVTSEAVPSFLPPGGTGLVVAGADDLGAGEVKAGGGEVTLTDRLPSGLTAVNVKGSVTQGGTSPRSLPTCSAPGEVVSCTYPGPLAPYERFQIEINVEVAAGLAGQLSNHVTVEGGGATTASGSQTLDVSGEQLPFGMQRFELSPFNENGTPDTEAGSHPFQLTTSLTFDQTAVRQPVQEPKDLHVILPPGLIGNPSATEQCTTADFIALVREANLCQAGSAIGVALVTVDEPAVAGFITKLVPVFNLVPAAGEPARFGFVIVKVPIILNASVRTGGGYNVVASASDLSQAAGVLSSQVTLWGVPGAAVHDQARGWECVAEGFYQNQIQRKCPSTAPAQASPFLTLPTSCAGDPASEPVVSSVEADSWLEPNDTLTASYIWSGPNGEPLGLSGCGRLPFSPQIAVAPEEAAGDAPVHAGSTPSGLSVSVKVPQATTLEAGGLAEADVRDTTVTLPEGVQLSPSAANGLLACPEHPEEGYEGIGFEGLQPLGPGGPEVATFTKTFRLGEEEREGQRLAPSCPEASKLGTVRIKTPLLPKPLEGAVYLASPAPNGEPGRNPFNSLVALYIVAEDKEAGVLVKLAGKGELNESTLRVSTTFANTPQLPFEELQLQLFGGPRASLSTPALCGEYASEALFTPWSGTGTVSVDSPGEDFAISEDCSTGRPLGFAPGFATQNTSAQAGAFTGFDLELSRPDGDQALSTVSMHLPEGVAALLSSVELCSEAQAVSSACPAGSQIGQATAIAGVGSEPYVQQGGKVYITGPYGGAPFGLEIVTPADAGPFNLGYVTVRSKLYVSPENASVTIVSDPLPTQLRGIPLQLKRVLISVDKQGFEFNPTDCSSPLKVQGTIAGSEGASSGVSSAYPLGGCQTLPFNPVLSASAVGHGSKAAGTTFKVIVRSGGVDAAGVAQAGIAKVDLQLPKQLSSRLPTLQKACSEAAFNSNAASCDEGSVIGYATIHTPVLKNPLSGPAYLVSHGNAAFPDVEFVLQGEGITLVLDGKTQIKNEITYSKFESTPDAPFTVFETVLPAGPHGVLTPNVSERKHFDLCGETLQMPTMIIGHNGTLIERDTKIAIQGCGAVKAVHAKKFTNAQKLAKALAACHKRYKHAKNRREACERLARRRYPLGNKAARSRHAQATKNTPGHDSTGKP